MTGPSAPRVVDCPSGNAYKVSVTSLPYCIIWRNKYSADWLAALASPYPAAPDFSTGKRVTRFSGRFAPLRIVFPCHPYAGGRINRSMLSCRDMAPWLSTHSPTAPRRKGSGASHQRGIALPRAKRGWPVFPRAKPGRPVFAAKGGIKNGAPKGAHLASAAILHNYPGRKPSTRL